MSIYIDTPTAVAYLIAYAIMFIGLGLLAWWER